MSLSAPPPYGPEAVANYFLDKAQADGRDLSPMKLQKLVYYAHGWHLALRGGPLVDERFEAWRYGPVLPSLYREFRDFKEASITRPATVWSGGGEEYVVAEAPDEEEVRALLERVWEVYGGFSASQLSAMTHRKGSAWDLAVRKSGSRIPMGLTISDNLIEESFRDELGG